MRFPMLLLALAGAVGMTGCSSLISLNPFVTAQEGLTDASLTGVWNGADDGAVYSIQQNGSAYTITYTDDNAKTPSKFQGTLFQVGDAKLMQIVTTNEDPFQVPVYVAVRVWPSADTLRWAFLDSDWMKEQAKPQVAAQPAGDRTLLTASGTAVRSFLTKFGADSQAYGNTQVLQRAH